MRLTLIWPGKTKEGFIKEGIKKYIKDLSTMAEVRVVEIKEEKGRPVEAALREEGRRILKQTGGKDYVLLDEKGKMMSSEGLARFLDGRDEWQFVLGGPYGLSAEVKGAAPAALSLSQMTFPYELARVVLLEQLYRAVSILKGRGYHHS